MRANGWQKFEDVPTIHWMLWCDKEARRAKQNMRFRREEPINDENYVTLYETRISPSSGHVRFRRIELSNGEICDVVRTRRDRAPAFGGFWGRL